MSDRAHDDAMTETEARAARRARGLERMGEVYDFEVSDGPGDFYGYTLEHLFGDVWERPGLSLRDRRLLLIGLMVAEGLDDVLQIQLDSALAKGDLSAEELRETVVFLAHYAGWPKAAGMNSRVETAIARRNKSTGAAT
jgi:4-carboxymuconolactone decarboxylase